MQFSEIVPLGLGQFGPPPTAWRGYGMGRGPCGYVWAHHVWPGGPQEVTTHVVGFGLVAIALGLYFGLRRRPQGVSGLGDCGCGG